MATAEELFGISNPNAEKELSEWYDEVIEAIKTARPELSNELKYYSHLPIEYLTYADRTEYMRRYRDITRMDQALGSMAGTGSMPTRINNIFNSLAGRRRNNPNKGFGRMPGAPSGSFLSRVYSRMNIQYNSLVRQDMAGRVTDKNLEATDRFSMGRSSIPSKSRMFGGQYSKGMLEGKRVLTYDLETAGFQLGQIREVGYAVSGREPIEPITFNPPAMNRGLVRIDGREGTLPELLGSKAPKVSTGSDFSRRVEPFLDEILEADFIAGHNIRGFDNEQLFVGLSRTTRYKTNKQFRSKVDAAFDKVNNYSIDTLEMVREMPGLKDLRVSPGLSRRGQFTTYSIANLLLETDLSDRIGIERLAELLGYDSATGTMTGTGLHNALVDTEVTNAIIQAAEEGGLNAKTLSSKSLQGSGMTGGESARMVGAIRQQIINSAAITPFTDLREVDHITDGVLRKLIDSYNGKDGLIFDPQDTSIISLLESGSDSDKQKAFNMLRGGQAVPKSIKMNYLEQQIISERNIGAGLGTPRPSNVSSVIGSVNKTVSGNVGTAHTPFAGLSREEQRIGHVISRATSNVRGLTSFDRKVAGISNDLLISRFRMFDSNDVFEYVTRSGNISLPKQVLKEMDLLKENDRLTMSFVESSAKSNYGAVNLIRNLTDEEAQAAQKRILKLAKSTDEELAEFFGGNADSVKAFKAAIKDGLISRIGKEKRIAVGQLYGAEDGEAVRTIKNAIQDFFGEKGYVRDDHLNKLTLPLYGGVQYDQGLVRTAGVVYDRAVTSGDIDNTLTALLETSHFEEGFREVAGSKTQYARARMLSDAGEFTDKAAQALRNRDNFFHYGKKGAVVLGVAAVGALLFSKSREREQLNETIDFQGYETGRNERFGIYDNIQQLKASGYDGSAQTFDPLRTAHYVNNMNSSRVGHTYYDWDRSNAIYGGVL